MCESVSVSVCLCGGLSDEGGREGEGEVFGVCARCNRSLSLPISRSLVCRAISRAGTPTHCRLSAGAASGFGLPLRQLDAEGESFWTADRRKWEADEGGGDGRGGEREAEEE